MSLTLLPPLCERSALLALKSCSKSPLGPRVTSSNPQQQQQPREAAGHDLDFYKCLFENMKVPPGLSSVIHSTGGNWTSHGIEIITLETLAEYSQPQKPCYLVFSMQQIGTCKIYQVLANFFFFVICCTLFWPCTSSSSSHGRIKKRLWTALS